MINLAIHRARAVAHDYRTAFAAADIDTAYDQFLFDPTLAGPRLEAMPERQEAGNTNLLRTPV